MIKRLIIMLVVVAVIGGAIVGFNMFRARMIGEFLASRTAPPQTVTAMQVAASDWVQQLGAIGTLRAVRGVDLAFEVGGTVTRLEFTSGQEVAAGQVLARLFDADEAARLRQLEANVKLAEINLRRTRQQLTIQAVAQSQADNDQATLDSARAAFDQQAALLTKRVLRAPFAGRLGISTINVGQYVRAGDVIVTLQQLDPILVDFFLPQQELGRLAVGQAVDLTADAFAGQTYQGKISAINPRIDANTRNVQVEASVPNPKSQLMPGMYVDLRLTVGKPESLLTLPQTAVSYNPYGDTVYLVVDDGKDAEGKPKQKARQTFVTLGARRGDQVAVLKGLEAGQTVVTSGLMKLKNDTPLLINNSVQPPNNPNPTPQEP